MTMPTVSLRDLLAATKRYFFDHPQVAQPQGDVTGITTALSAATTVVEQRITTGAQVLLLIGQLLVRPRLDASQFYAPPHAKTLLQFLRGIIVQAVCQLILNDQRVRATESRRARHDR
jgi:hypothetical protein